jgi:hypothetical protein
MRERKCLEEEKNGKKMKRRENTGRKKGEKEEGLKGRMGFKKNMIQRGKRKEK